MIGTALSKADMRRLIDHMGETEQPWVCVKLTNKPIKHNVIVLQDGTIFH